MTTLSPGANAPLARGPLTATVSFTPAAGADLDVSAFLLGANGKVRGDADMCFFGQTLVANGAVQLSQSAPGRVVFSLNLDRLDAAVEKVALTATIYENKARFAAFPHLTLSVSGGIEAPIPTQGMQETALILGEFYRREGAWKFRCVAQGFAGGLEPLATHFGVEIAAPTASPPATPAPVPTPPAPVSLSKITLDKSRASISLEKKGDGDFGEIKINLNWNRPTASGGLFSGLLGRSGGVDLDVGCLFELQDGRKGVIQALGKAFGSFDDAPYIHLMGDDRTGAVRDGEWLRINGKEWRNIRRVLVYAFIYQGVPNWNATDGVVTLFAPGQPPIEVRVSEEGGNLGCCAIALLENVAGSVKVSREVRFFQDQQKVDHAYQWGLRWSAGSK
ncbi:MAG: tellurium resistance protein TerA [Pseudomonadales bacterium GWC1_66_9]|nr:MAG: tellurium resistance protein TerA [Pseudomonadales bacterium GWC1_66_9]